MGLLPKKRCAHSPLIHLFIKEIKDWKKSLALEMHNSVDEPPMNLQPIKLKASNSFKCICNGSKLIKINDREDSQREAGHQAAITVLTLIAVRLKSVATEVRQTEITFSHLGWYGEVAPELNQDSNKPKFRCLFQIIYHHVMNRQILILMKKKDTSERF